MSYPRFRNGLDWKGPMPCKVCVFNKEGKCLKGCGFYEYQGMWDWHVCRFLKRKDEE